MVTIGASLFFAEISGSAVADVAAIGSIPAMKKRGYPAAFAAAVTSSSATLAVVIPPSIPRILYAVMSDSSVVQLFVAGIVPGVSGLGLVAMAWHHAKKHGLPVEQAFELARLKRAFREALRAPTLPLVILGGISGGIVTATAGAGLAVPAALVIGLFVHRELDLRALVEATVEGVVQTAVVMLPVASPALLGVYPTEQQGPQQLAAALLAFTDDRYAILAILDLFFPVIGLFLHSAAAIIPVVPIVVPLVHQVGIDPVHFGLVVTLDLGIGQQTPPVASVPVTACSVAKADIREVSKAKVRFVAVLRVVPILCTCVPAVPMTLIELFYR